MPNPGDEGAAAGAIGSARAMSEDEYFRSLLIPVDTHPARDGQFGLPAEPEPIPWATEPSAELDQPMDSTEARRAHLIGAPKRARRRPLPVPVIAGMVGAAAIVLLIVVLMLTGGDSTDSVEAQGSGRAATRPIPTLPPIKSDTSSPTTVATEEPAPEPEAQPRATATRSATNTEEIVVDLPPADPVVSETTPTAPPTTPTTPTTAAPTPVLPGAPTGVSATAGSQQATVSWTAPSDGGSAITEYKIQYFDGTTWTEVLTGSSATTFIVTGLADGTPYVFQVAAVNGVGTGPWSTSSASVTPIT